MRCGFFARALVVFLSSDDEQPFRPVKDLADAFLSVVEARPAPSAPRQSRQKLGLTSSTGDGQITQLGPMDLQHMVCVWQSNADHGIVLTTSKSAME